MWAVYIRKNSGEVKKAEREKEKGGENITEVKDKVTPIIEGCGYC